jgi:hypothetical protein
LCQDHPLFARTGWFVPHSPGFGRGPEPPPSQAWKTCLRKDSPSFRRLPCWAGSSSLTRLSTCCFPCFSTGSASCGGERCGRRGPGPMSGRRQHSSMWTTHHQPANRLQPEKPSCQRLGRADHDGWTGAVAWLSTGSPRKDSKNGQAENGTAKSRGSTRGTSTSERRIGISFTA